MKEESESSKSIGAKTIKRGKKVKKKEEERNQVNLYAKESDIRRTLIWKQPMIVLLYKQTCLNTNELNLSLPNVIISLLHEFEYVYPKMIPNSLPPTTRIEHQIDFILEASILNKPAYRSNLEETKEH